MRNCLMVTSQSDVQPLLTSFLFILGFTQIKGKLPELEERSRRQRSEAERAREGYRESSSNPRRHEAQPSEHGQQDGGEHTRIEAAMHDLQEEL